MRARARVLVAALLVAASASARVDIGRTTRTTLANGLKVVVVERPGLPLVDVLVVVRGGSSSDPGAQAGLASFAVECLRRGAGTRSAVEVAEALDSLGAQLTTETGADDARIELSLLAKDLPAGLDVLADLVQHPRFAESEVEKEKAQTLARLEQDKDEPTVVASRHFGSFLFGRHPYGHPAAGRASSVATLGAADVARWHGQWFVPSNTIVVAVGDVTAAHFLAEAKARFGGWRGIAPPALRVADATPVAGRKVLLLDKDDATQSQVRLGNVGIRRADPDWEEFALANTVLGSGFTSRLVEKLRVDMSLTYGVSSQVSGRRARGSIQVSTFTPTETTRKVVDAALDVVDRFQREGPTAEELDKARGYRAGLFAIQLQSFGAVAGAVADVEVYGLPPDSLETTLDRYAAVTLERARAAARRFPIADWALVVLGKASLVKGQLEGLGPVTVTPFTTEP